MRLASLLFVSVGLTHFAPDWIASLYGNAEQATKAWFYILRGLEGVVLFAVVGCLTRSISVAVVCLWGLLEEAQTAVCRLGKPIAESPPHELFTGLCGQPAYVSGLIAALVIGTAIGYEISRRGHGSKGPR